MIDNIGVCIAGLRKSKGVKQEDVAKAVGVSAQAVSKWENGGTPDTELLPIIADFFGVSIDRLFGRNKTNYSHIETDVTRYIAEPLDNHVEECKDFDNVPPEVHAVAMDRAQEICWAVNIGLFGTKILDNFGFHDRNIFDDIRENVSGGVNMHAEIINDSGIAVTSLSGKFPYFMFSPEPKQGWSVETNDLEEYRKAFAILSEPNVLECLHLIHTKEPEKKFSSVYFSKQIGMGEDRAAKMLSSLSEMGYIKASVIELDDTEQTFYSIVPNHIFIMLLLLMKSYIAKQPKAVIGCTTRDKSFLQGGETK